VSRFQFVADHKCAFGVKRLCRVLKVSRSGFYRWLAAAPARAARLAADAQLAAKIKKIHAGFDGTYGSRGSQPSCAMGVCGSTTSGWSG
jgi:hypothetical protein